MKLKLKIYILAFITLVLCISLTGCLSSTESIESSSEESSQQPQSETEESVAESSNTESETEDSTTETSSSESETENLENQSSSSESDLENPDSEEPDCYFAVLNPNNNVISSPYTGDASVPEELAGLYYSSDFPGGNPKNDGTGNIWLVLKPVKKYRVYDIKIEGQYSSVECVGGDLYCIYGVESDLTVTTSTKSMSIAQREIFSDYGYGISDDGKITVTWEENPEDPIRYVEVSHNDGTGSRVEYIDASLGKAELFSMTEDKIYSVSLRAVGYNNVGQMVVIKACYMEEPRSVAFPRVEITTENYIWPQCDFVQSPDGCWGAGITNAFYEQCIVTLYNENNEVVYSSSAENGQDEEFLGAKLKIRGNTSATYSSNQRYPYKLKLDKKYDLLEPLIGRPDDSEAYADKDWVLLNYGADGYRICGDAIADAVETEWSPDYCYVSLYLNGEYRGLYVLSEAVEEGSGESDEKWRVNVDSDGYVFECDAYWWNEDLYFSTPMTENTPMYFTFKYPDSDQITQDSFEYAYLRNDMIEFEQALQKDDDSYLDYIDLDSFVKWLLVSDYLCINDGGGCNIFLYKKDSTSDTKITMGPNWDFDSYMGNVEALATIRIYWNGAPFYYPYLIKKESFQQRYKELFAETYGLLNDSVNEAFSQIDEEAYMTLLKYENARFGTSVKSLSTRKQEFLAWLDEHLEWMETQFK